MVVEDSTLELRRARAGDVADETRVDAEGRARFRLAPAGADSHRSGGLVLDDGGRRIQCVDVVMLGLDSVPPLLAPARALERSEFAW